MSHQALLGLHLHDNFLSFQLMHKDLKQCEQMDDGFCSGVECGDRQKSWYGLWAVRDKLDDARNKPLERKHGLLRSN